ncbi:MAG: PAS domain S-box protein [bacterium]|nr:PAS domain S-box protein [bacterium]
MPESSDRGNISHFPRTRGKSRSEATPLPYPDALGTLFERVALAVAVLDANGRVRRLNAAFEDLFQVRTAELVGRDLDEMIVPEEERAAAQELQERACAGIEARAKTRRKSRDGSIHDVEIHLIPYLVDGEPGGIFATYHDVSEQRTLEEQLRQAQKMEAIGQLAGGIAHDFNNLLTAIVGYSEILELTLAGNVGLQQNALEIRKAGERAGRLTQRLLAFSRKQGLEPTKLHLNTVVLELEKTLLRLIGEHIRIHSVLDPALGIVWADRGQLEQVVINLVVNARDAMPEGGTLIIETSNTNLDGELANAYPTCRPGPFVQLSIRDTGCGIDPDIQSKIFDPFFTTKQEGEGTGLGLAGVYGIVTQNEGYIRVESVPGAGSTFDIGLPRIMDPGVGLMPADPSGLISFGRETILLVEDDAGVLQVTQDFLELAGYRVLPASGEAEALQQLENFPEGIDLLLTDVVLPCTNGPELARKLTALRPEMKVLYQSGYLDNEVLRQGGPEPGRGYLQKPVRQKIMTQKIREILDS